MTKDNSVIENQIQRVYPAGVEIVKSSFHMLEIIVILKN